MPLNKTLTVIPVLFTLFLTSCAALETGGELISGVTSYFLGGEDNIEPPAELVEIEAEVSIEEIWAENVGSGSENQFLNLGIAAGLNKIVAADGDGLLVAFNIDTGEEEWEQETEYQFSAGPGIGGQTVIMATSNAEVLAFDLNSGEKIWEKKVSSEVLASPVIEQNTVIIRTTDGRIFALSEDEGIELWSFERSVPTLSIRGTGSPIIVEENVIAGYANGKLLALRLIDGKNIWETSIAIPSGRSEIERLVDLDVDPVETDGVIFISSYQGGSTAVLEIDGDVLWRNEEVSSFSGMSYDWRYLYISDSNSHVWQLDQRNGASLWKQKKLSHRNLTTPVAYDDYVVTADLEGYVHWLNVNDGRQMGRIQVTDSAIRARPLVIDKRLFVYATDGTLSALQAKPN